MQNLCDQVQDVVFEGLSTEASSQIGQITADFIDGKITPDELEEKLKGVRI